MITLPLRLRFRATRFIVCSNWTNFSFVPEDRRLELVKKGAAGEQLGKAIT